MTRGQSDSASHRNAPPRQFHDPLTSLWERRDLLRVGALSVAGALLPDSLSSRGRLEGAEASPRTSGRRAESVIFLWMAGGVTHIDSFDPKPEAPTEIRGTLRPIATTLPGVQFCETMPEMAQVAHELTLLRSFSHDSDDHLLSQVYTLSGRKVTRNVNVSISPAPGT